MASHERRVALARQQALNKASQILEQNPRFPAAQVRAINASNELGNLSEVENQWGTAARFEAVLHVLDLRSAAYLDLVEDLKSQKAFMSVLQELGRLAWQEYSGFPPEIAEPVPGDVQFDAIQNRVRHWVAEGYKRLMPVAADPAESAAALHPASTAETQHTKSTKHNSTSSVPPKVFISYSWDSELHREWVRRLASRLREQGGVDVTLDRWHLQPGDQLPQFMESAVRENDYVLIVCTPDYRSRADQRKGGVGYEGDIMSAEVYTSANHRKFVPLLREGEWGQAAPSWLSGKVYLDFRGNPYPERSYDMLLKTLHGELNAAPPIGPRPDFSGTMPARPPVQAASLTEDVGNTFEGCYRRAREAMDALGVNYHRRVDMVSVTTLDVPVAVLWQAAQRAQAASSAADSNRPWPLVFHFFDQETTRAVYPWGFSAEFVQSADRGGPNYEYVASHVSGALRVLETEALAQPHRNAFYYDRSIGTVADAIEFAQRFFRNLGLGEANEVLVHFEWSGLSGRHIAAERAQILPSYQQCISRTDAISSEIRFRLADATNDLAGKAEKVLTKVFNQFGLFHPKSKVYEQIIEKWKSGE